jgi:hypothetical protein
MTRVYDDRALEMIAAKIGPCLEGRARGEMLEHIEQAAQDYLTVERDYNTERRATMVAQLEAAGAGDDLLKYARSGASICRSSRSRPPRTIGKGCARRLLRCDA